MHILPDIFSCPLSTFVTHSPPCSLLALSQVHDFRCSLFFRCPHQEKMPEATIEKKGEFASTLYLKPATLSRDIR